MQKLFTATGKVIPVHQVVRHQGLPSLEIQVFESQASELGEDLFKLLHNSAEMSTLTLKSSENVIMNSYVNYSKLDSLSIQYDAVVNATHEGSNADDLEVSESVDTLITITLLQKSALEVQVENTSELVDAMSVALAQMLGG